MGGAEAVEEMEERNAALDRGKMRNQRKIHHFLNGGGGQHGKPGLSATHDIRMISKDRKRMRGQCARADMKHAGQQFAGDFVHIRDHQQQTLRSGKRRGECARLERAVHGAGGAAFALHFSDAYSLSKQVRSAVGSPIVRNFRHGRGRRDRVNCRYVRKRIRNVRRGGVPVDGHGFCHFVDAS
ncbi:hypothetical protein SDC9_188883 [bioreactor metagenome]|uniref:Uncharacterized protein n=1 Tax=bioreactor metagenome TaxID=1076179 RepID=A0A645HR57_9ZZZZ